MVRRFFLLSIILFLLSLPLFSALSPSVIFYADRESLINMCSARGIDIADDDVMRASLYQYENIERFTEEEDSEEGSYNVEIRSADKLERKGSIVTISGNASLSFSDSEKGERRLSAGMIIIDSDNGRITALDDVSFVDESENASLNEIFADIVTVFWKSGKVYVSDATTSSERRNSEDQTVTFYTQGERLVYLPEGGILYENGYVSSNPEHRHSSLKAKELAMLSGGDMFISDAYLSIGRVPILYLPFFFFPGSRINGNPAFGFDSEKGAFLNTTFELLGTNKNIASQEKSSSFSAILQSGENDTDLIPQGFYYRNSDSSELSKAEAWARKSESFISLMGDVYSGKKSNSSLKNGGLMAGLDSEINLFGKDLKLKTYSALASSSEIYPGHGRFRYFTVNSLKYTSRYGLSIDASYPLYSDNRVLIDFGNRLSGFSIDPLLFQNPEFPSTYTSEISSISRGLSLSYSLPSKYASKYLSSLSISSLRIREQLTWDSSSLRDNRYTYKLDNIELPVLNASISGAVFSTSGKIVEKAETEENAEVKESDAHLLEDPLLKSLYKAENSSAKSSIPDSYSAALKYSISENANNTMDYSYGELKTRKLSSVTSSKISFEGVLSSVFKLTASFLPSYSYSKNETHNSNGSKISYAEISTSSANSEIIAEIPYLGIKYTLGTKVYMNKKTIEYTIEDSIKGDVSERYENLEPDWDKNTVTAHSISFSKAFTAGDRLGTITPSISYTLPPLSGMLRPGLAYKNGPFASQFYWKFAEDNENGSRYDSDLIELSLGYNGTYFTSNFSGKYQSRNFRSDDFLYPFYMNASASVRTKDKVWALTEYIDYAYYDSFRNNIRSLKTTLTASCVEASFNWISASSTELKFSDIAMKIALKSAKLQLWKGRIYFDFALSSSLKIDFINRYNSKFTITPSIVFSIAEFLDMKFSFTTNNNSFYKYFDGNDKFSLPLLFADLGKSFDFFGDGRRHTSFIMNNAKLELVHYMEDWDLHCAYTAEVVLSNNRYSLVPEFSIYLAWKTMPDLKVDQTWRKNSATSKWEKK